MWTAALDLLGKYGEYDLAKRQAENQAAQAQAIAASQAAAYRVNGGGMNLTPLLLIGGAVILAVVLTK